MPATSPNGARPTDEPTPEELACLAQAGSSESFARLVERFTDPLYNFLALRTPNPADAEELVQETFLRAWHRLDRYDREWRFSTWIFTIAKRLATSGWRRARPWLCLTGACSSRTLRCWRAVSS